jgi:preprotein translocase SecE subunit
MEKFFKNLKEFPSTAKTFLQEVKVEWTKVTKPGKNEVVTTTVVVVVTSVIFALYLWGSDRVIIFLYEHAFKALTGS